MEEIKILVAGNKNYGLAKAIYELYPHATFLSRSTGYNLYEKENRQKTAEMSLEYDVFISVSCLEQFAQTMLVEAVMNQWWKENHKGYLIAIGSSADTPVKGTKWAYPAEKKALRAYCRQQGQAIASDTPPNWRVTYLSPGNMHTPNQDIKMPTTLKLDTSYVAGVIQWLVNQPKNINISELCLDRIQVK
jgi:NAD(P)-dependent dehydrogenase (short-subunit alcohol dehydrogenase family)